MYCVNLSCTFAPDAYLAMPSMQLAENQSIHPIRIMLRKSLAEATLRLTSKDRLLALANIQRRLLRLLSFDWPS